MGSGTFWKTLGNIDMFLFAKIGYGAFRSALQTGAKSRSGFSRWSFLGVRLDVGLTSKPCLPSATPTRGHSSG